MHALIVAHYLKGGYYPVGGAQNIARSIGRVIEGHGGKCLTNREVMRILVAAGRVVGVESVKGRGGKHPKPERYAAPVVVSDTGAELTFNRLLDEAGARTVGRELQHHSGGLSAVSLYLGLSRSPGELGFRGENHWLYSGYDHQQMAASVGALLEGRCPAAFLSFPSLKDPVADVHTAEVIAFADYRHFENWKDKPWKKRGEEYEALKETIAQGMLELIEQHHPGFRKLVDYYELSTPLSMEYFTGRPRGAMYGVPPTPTRFRLQGLETRTPIRNLYLAGSDVCSPGIVGAMMGGVAAASAVNGPFGFFKIISRIRREAKDPKPT
jgi:phytoene dehydrogenase-like protein